MNIHAECNRLIDVFRGVKLPEVEDAIAKAKREGLEIPSSIEDKLHDTICRYLDMEKGVVYGEKEEAIKEIPKLIELMDQVRSDVFKLYLAEPYQKACATRKFFKRYEDLASQHIDNYKEHNENFCKIKELMESDEKLSEFQIGTYGDQLKNFVNDFELGKPGLSVAINRAKKVDQVAQDSLQLQRKSVELEEKIAQQGKKSVEQGNEIIRLKKNQSWLSILSVGAAVISAFVGLKSCVSCTSSQQPVQPEAQLQSATNNSTLNP